MPESCVPLYDLLGSGPSAYALTSTYIVFALPIFAGLALLAKRIIGQASSRISIGIISAALWAILLAVHWAAPQFSSQVLPSQLSALVFILLFSGTLFEWLFTAYRSRLRPFVKTALATGCEGETPCLRSLTKTPTRGIQRFHPPAADVHPLTFPLSKPARRAHIVANQP